MKWINFTFILILLTPFARADGPTDGQTSVTLYAQWPTQTPDTAGGFYIFKPGGSAGVIIGNQFLRFSSGVDPTIAIQNVVVSILLPMNPTNLNHVNRAYYGNRFGDGKVLAITGIPTQTNLSLSLSRYVGLAGAVPDLYVRFDGEVQVRILPESELLAGLTELGGKPVTASCPQTLTPQKLRGIDGDGTGLNRPNPKRWKVEEPWRDFANITGG